MERELWKAFYGLALELDNRDRLGRYSTAVIVSVYMWAVASDRPVSWACRKEHWPEELLRLRRFRLPSQATMSRRLRAPDTQELFAKITHRLTEAWTFCWLKFIDAKPLPIGGYSKDRDAKWGQCIKGFAKGYKLFAIWGAGPMPLAWDIGPMNRSEVEVAKRLIPQARGGGYLLGDALYDANDLYVLAAKHGYQLVAPRKKPNAGWGHRAVSAERRRSAALLQSEFGDALYDERTHIERNFGWLTSCAGGLQPLQAWVRRHTRVRQWVQGKLILNALRRQPRLTAVA